MSNRIVYAARLAFKAHDGQVRKYTNQPYIVHPAQVANRAMLYKYFSVEEAEIAACAGWVHDVAEDTQYTIADIANICGEDVALVAKELTNPSKGMKAPRAERKRIDREHLAGVSKMGKILKMIDRIVNLNDMIYCQEKDFLRLYSSESLELLKVIGDVDSELKEELFMAAQAVGLRGQND